MSTKNTVLSWLALCFLLPVAVLVSAQGVVENAEKLEAKKELIQTVPGYSPGFIIFKDEKTQKLTGLNVSDIIKFIPIDGGKIHIRTMYFQFEVKSDWKEFVDKIAKSVKGYYD